MKKILSKKQKSLGWVGGIIILIITARLVLPYVVLHYANKTLAGMDGYYGHIEDIDLAIIRGAYRVDRIYINKADTVTGRQTPFFSAALIDLSIEWNALIKGSIAGEVQMDRPVLIFTKDKVEPGQIVRDSADFKRVLDGLMPLDINRFQAHNGKIQYKDLTSVPNVDIEINQLEMLAQNLRNSYDSTSMLPATLHAGASVYEGKLTLDARLNPMANDPTFDMSAELNNTNLVKLNDFFQAYAKVDVNKGNFGLYSEVAAKESGFAGYVKPLIKNLDVLGKEDRQDNLFHKMWEGFVGGVGKVLQNRKEDQVATKIPFKGKLDDPKTNVWVAIGTVLQNAFIHALQPAIDNEIDIRSVSVPKEEKKTFLQKIFGGEKKQDKKDKPDREKKKEKKSRK